jgi:hypothetical protein
MDINLPNEANRQRAFLTTLRESYGGLQAQENLLLTMESMQELEPVNPDDLQLLGTLTCKCAKISAFSLTEIVSTSRFGGCAVEKSV